MSDDANRFAEERARDLIDVQLRAAGWDVQSHGEPNLFAAQGVARREAVLRPERSVPC